MLKFKKELLPIIIISLSICIALCTFSLIPFTGGDNFAYFSISRAIAQGKGYTELWNPNLSLHTQYPPIFPILLLPAALFNSYSLAKIIVFLCYMFSLFFSYCLFKELNDSKSNDTTLLALSFLAFTPVLLEYGSWVLSEIPYILVSILSLYFWSKNRYNVSLFFAILTFLTRTAGITLLITVSFFYLLKFKEEKKKIILPLLSLSSIILWMGYTHTFKDSSQQSYLQQLLFKNPYNPDLGNINILDLLTRVFQNIWAMPLKVFYQIFWGEVKSIPFPLFIGILLLGLIIIGVCGDKIFPKKTKKDIKKNSTKFSTINLIKIYLPLYLLTVWTWPTVWSADKRFYLPILPLIAFWLGKGVTETVKKLPKNTAKKFLVFIIPGILAIHCIFTSLTGSAKIWENNRKWLKDGFLPKETFYLQSYINVAKWISNEKIPKNSVFIARKPQAFYHYTRFPAARVPRTQKPQDLKHIIETNKINYITVSAFFNSRFILLSGMNALKEEYEFTPVYIDADKTIAVFKCNKKPTKEENLQVGINISKALSIL